MQATKAFKSLLLFKSGEFCFAFGLVTLLFERFVLRQALLLISESREVRFACGITTLASLSLRLR